MSGSSAELCCECRTELRPVALLLVQSVLLTLRVIQISIEDEISIQLEMLFLTRALIRLNNLPRTSFELSHFLLQFQETTFVYKRFRPRLIFFLLSLPFLFCFWHQPQCSAQMLFFNGIQCNKRSSPAVTRNPEPAAGLHFHWRSGSVLSSCRGYLLCLVPLLCHISLHTLL